MPNDLNPDFQDLIDCLTFHGVDYLLVGAHALAFQGVARFTEHLDVWMRRTEENASRAETAMAAFGIKLSAEAVKALTEERKMLRSAILRDGSRSSTSSMVVITRRRLRVRSTK